MHIDPDAFAEKKQLVDAAVAVYNDDPGKLTTGAICQVARTDRITFASYFDAPEDALAAFYTLVFEQYHLIRLSTEGYAQFSFEERLATFLYILTDVLEEQRAFVQATFDTQIRCEAAFREHVQAELQRLLQEDTVPETNRVVTRQWPVYTLFTEAVLRIIRFWMHDTSTNREATTALIDKLVSFTAEVVTFRGVQRGADLAWYATKVDVLGLSRLPVVRWFFGS
ncbi:MAG: hypothetical protein PPP56_01310 [Longimonas sp.]|uniref:hypothetical protein n=1 Tax=Longimonas sp. TaxID=2039626 RepID=UPI003351AC80